MGPHVIEHVQAHCGTAPLALRPPPLPPPPPLQAAAAAAASHLEILLVRRVRAGVRVPLLGLLLVARILELALEVERIPDIF